MADQVSWLPSAIGDLEAIAAYIAADSPAHAAAVVARMLVCAAELPRFPRSCRRVPELDDHGIRERHVYSYRLIFRVCEAAQTIEVLAVIHGARLLPNDIRERL